MVDELLEHFDTFSQNDLQFLNELLDYVTERPDEFASRLDSALNTEAYKNNLCPLCFSEGEWEYHYEKSEYWGSPAHERVATLKCLECGWTG